MDILVRRGRDFLGYFPFTSLPHVGQTIYLDDRKYSVSEIIHDLNRDIVIISIKPKLMNQDLLVKIDYGAAIMPLLLLIFLISFIITIGVKICQTDKPLILKSWDVDPKIELEPFYIPEPAPDSSQGVFI